MRTRRQYTGIYRWDRSAGGFTLVELMIVVAITAVLAAVAVPAYVNHMSRARQGEAVNSLMIGRMEQEAYYEERNRFVYARTVGCLPSFWTGANTTCLNNCAACPQTAFLTSARGYTITVTLATANTFIMRAQRTIPSSGVVDTLTISAGSATPTVVTPDAIGFSWFQWLFS